VSICDHADDVCLKIRGEPQITLIPRMIAAKDFGVNSEVKNSSSQEVKNGCDAKLGARLFVLLEFLNSRLLGSDRAPFSPNLRDLRNLRFKIQNLGLAAISLQG
jgi:hypothetical protein